MPSMEQGPEAGPQTAYECRLLLASADSTAGRNRVCTAESRAAHGVEHDKERV
ncbi:hypothetical protein [Streptomyces sp. bgisy034]|uniref:hypothetical protein n=1 Tax=Streptomyces sp. bgisy034 TaxID=3413774 RepID=UPI003EC05FA5